MARALPTGSRRERSVLLVGPRLLVQRPFRANADETQNRLKRRVSTTKTNLRAS